MGILAAVVHPEVPSQAAEMTQPGLDQHQVVVDNPWDKGDELEALLVAVDSPWDIVDALLVGLLCLVVVDSPAGRAGVLRALPWQCCRPPQLDLQPQAAHLLLVLVILACRRRTLPLLQRALPPMFSQMN